MDDLFIVIIMKVQLNRISHRGESVLLLTFPKDAKLVSLAKSIGCRFSITHKGWWLADNPENNNRIQEVFGAYLKSDESVKITKVPTKKNSL